MGAATTLGSEPMVGMQWVERLRARGEVTVLTTEIFRNPKFLPTEHWSDMVFIDTRATDEADYANNFGRHLWRWWLGVRAHLKAHALPGDRLLITAPAAIWMLPWVAGLPIPRERVFFGPLGVNWTPRAVRAGIRADLRNLRTAVALVAWRLLAPWLPRDLAIRAPFDGFEKTVGKQFRVLGALPEVLLPPLQFSKSATSSQTFSLVFETRKLKRFDASFALALELAKKENSKVVVIGTPEHVAENLAYKAHTAGVILELMPRMERSKFTSWLAEFSPDMIMLSMSEGVPSMLIEALLAGCRLHVHPVGGIHWLIGYGCDMKPYAWHGAPVESFRWNEASLQNYTSETKMMFSSLMAKIFNEIEDQFLL